MSRRQLIRLIPMAAGLLLATMLLPLRIGAQSCDYWLAPDGDDENPGTLLRPWATLEHASETVPDNGCTVWLKDGLYRGENHLVRRYATETTFRAVNPYRAVLENDGMVINLDGARNMVFDGFEIRHRGPDATVLVIKVDRSEEVWSEQITFRNNIIHDSWNNDLFKLHNGARMITVEKNVFYNAGASEHHLDVNSVTDVTIQDNLFFNDYAGSGRTDPANSKAFITIKDSNGDEDGLEGNERITVRRNVFLNWEGGRETFIQVGNDGKPYHEAEDVMIESNLFIGNAPNRLFAAVGVRGSKNVTFTHNTVVGDLPASAYAMWVSLKEQNPPNENIVFRDNIWADPTGTMGAGPNGGNNEFSNGDPAQTINLVLDNNLYWNGGAAIPDGDLVSPLLDDPHALVADPLLPGQQDPVILPRWNGTGFLSGNRLIREEFLRLVTTYGRLPEGSPAIGAAGTAGAGGLDILGNPRSATPDLGAFEYRMALTPTATCGTMLLEWTDPQEPQAESFTLALSGGIRTMMTAEIPVERRSYRLDDLPWSATYTVNLAVRDEEGGILAQTPPQRVETACSIVHLPLIFGHVNEIGFR